LVAAYRSSTEYKALALSTKQAWARWLDRIDEHFGNLRIVQFERTVKIRPIIIRWRSRWVDKPRTADFSLQVLSRILSHATETLGQLSGNPCEGIRTLYRVDRSEIIWTATDIDRLKQTCSTEIADAPMWRQRRVFGSVTSSGCRGRTSGRTRLPSAPAKVGTSGAPDFHYTITCGKYWRGFRSERRGADEQEGAPVDR
jgi:hypothetical protein